MPVFPQPLLSYVSGTVKYYLLIREARRLAAQGDY